MANIELKAYIAALTALATADNAADYLLILDTDTNTLKKVLPEDLNVGGGGAGGEIAGNNIAIGTNAMTARTTGADSVAIGGDTLKTQPDFIRAIAIGRNAMELSTEASAAVAIGYNAGALSLETTDCVYIGHEAGKGIVNGNAYGNVAIGAEAMIAVNDGNENIAIGNFVAAALNDAYADVIIGPYAGESITDGSENTLIGYNAGLNLTTGEGNVCIGAYSGIDSELVAGDYNVLIGWFAGSTFTGDFSNKLVIDSTSNTSTNALIYGEFDNKVLVLNGTVTVKPSPTNTAVHFDESVAAGETRMLIWDVDNGTLERVSVGAADSGGAGYKVLRIPN